MGYDVLIQKIFMCEAGLNVQNSLDVAQVLLAFSFLIENHFPKNNIFCRSNINFPTRRIFGKAMLPSPCKGDIAVSRIEVSLQTSRDVDQVKVAAAVAGNFRSDYIGWRAVIFWFRKTVEQGRDVLVSNEQGDIDIEGEAWFTVVHRADGAGDEISDAGLVQRTRKKGDQIRFGLE